MMWVPWVRSNVQATFMSAIPYVNTPVDFYNREFARRLLRTSPQPVSSQDMHCAECAGCANRRRFEPDAPIRHDAIARRCSSRSAVYRITRRGQRFAVVNGRCDCGDRTARVDEAAERFELTSLAYHDACNSTTPSTVGSTGSPPRRQPQTLLLEV
jgi:hypothetical protein